MDWYSIQFQPNLKFVLELKEDLRTKYYEQHEKAKQTLETFSYSLQDVFHKHQKLLADNIELFITNEKLKQIIDKHESNQQDTSTFNDNKSLQMSDANCNLEISKEITDLKESIDSEVDNSESIKEKENNIFVPIFSSDFDDESEGFHKHDSPPKSVVNYPVKVHNSPILCKRKKSISKRNNFLVTTSSVNVNTDIKNNLINADNSIEKNIDKIENKSNNEFNNKNNDKYLKMTENTFQMTPESIQDKSCNESSNILSFSKTSFGKSEFIKGGKKIRQTKLTLKKATPIIDISKVKCNENNNKHRIVNTCNEASLPKENICTNQKEYNKNELSNVQTECNKLKSIPENHNKSLKDDELIEISPVHNEKSKLRNKFDQNKKTSSRTIKQKTINFVNDKNAINLENIKDNSKLKNDVGCITNTFKSPNFKQNNVQNVLMETDKYKTTENQITLNDETYFSPAEKTHNENDIITAYNLDLSEFDDEMECENEADFNANSNKLKDGIKYDTPPAKKMLLNSFDVIPNRKPQSPDHAYKEGAIRNKNEKAELPGWCCRDCEKWYNHLPEEEKTKRKNECSKHRGKYKADILTPESFWNPTFDDTNNSTSFEYY